MPIIAVMMRIFSFAIVTFWKMMIFFWDLWHLHWTRLIRMMMMLREVMKALLRYLEKKLPFLVLKPTFPSFFGISFTSKEGCCFQEEHFAFLNNLLFCINAKRNKVFSKSYASQIMEKEEDSFFVLPKKYINGTYSWNGNVKKKFTKSFNHL